MVLLQFPLLSLLDFSTSFLPARASFPLGLSFSLHVSFYLSSMCRVVLPEIQVEVHYTEYK